MFEAFCSSNFLEFLAKPHRKTYHICTYVNASGPQNPERDPLSLLLALASARGGRPGESLSLSGPIPISSQDVPLFCFQNFVPL